MASGCTSGASHDDETQWMGELLLEDLVGGGGSCAEGGDQLAACTGSSCSKKRIRHINNERQRRILMNKLLDSLQSLLPDPFPRKDRCALLTDVITHVQSLEKEIQDLAARTAQMKMAKPRAPPAIPNSSRPPSPDTLVTANVSQLHVQFLSPYVEQQGMSSSIERNPSEEVIITFSSSPNKGLFTHVLAMLQKREIEVMNANLSTTPSNPQILYYIHARIPKQSHEQSEDLKSMLSKMSFQEEDITYSFAT